MGSKECEARGAQNSGWHKHASQSLVGRLLRSGNSMVRGGLEGQGGLGLTAGAATSLLRDCKRIT